MIRGKNVMVKGTKNTIHVSYKGKELEIPIINDGTDTNGNRIYLVKGSYLGIEAHHEYDRKVKIPNLTRSRKAGREHYFRFQSAYPNEDLLYMLKSVEQFYDKLKAKAAKQP